MSKYIYKNLDEFHKGKNILLITGLSGSGKSTLSKQFDGIHIELDLFEQCYQFQTLEEVKDKAGIIFYHYFTEFPFIYKKLKQKELKGNILGKEIRKFLLYVLNYCNNDIKNDYILEGVQIYSFLNIEEIKDYPLILIEIHYLKAMLQRIKRSLKNNERIKDLELFRMFLYYFQENKVIKKFQEGVITM